MSFSQKLNSLHDLANKLVEAVNLLCTLSRDMIPQINALQQDERIFDCIYALRVYCTEQFDRLDASIDEIRIGALTFNEAKQQAIQQLQTLLQIANQALETRNSPVEQIIKQDQALASNKSKKSKGGFLKFFLQCNGRLRDSANKK